jgi:hypothetical protein
LKKQGFSIPTFIEVKHPLLYLIGKKSEEAKPLDSLLTSRVEVLYFPAPQRSWKRHSLSTLFNSRSEEFNSLVHSRIKTSRKRANYKKNEVTTTLLNSFALEENLLK